MLGDALRAIENHLSSDDNVRLNQVFVDGIKSNDLQAIYFSALNLKDLSASEKTKVCERLVTLYTESKLNVSLERKITLKVTNLCFYTLKFISFSPSHCRNLKRIFIWSVPVNSCHAQVQFQPPFYPLLKHRCQKTPPQHMNSITTTSQTNMLEMSLMMQPKHESQLTYKAS